MANGTAILIPRRKASWLVGIVAALLLLAQVTEATIRFEAAGLDIPGLPADLSPMCWTTADMEGRGSKDLIVGGLSSGSEVVFMIRNNRGSLAAEMLMQRRLKPEEPSGSISSGMRTLSHCDLYRDGREEVFVIGSEPDEHTMLRWNHGVVEQAPLPFPKLAWPVVAWLDYDGDGWVDLFLAGSERVDGQLRRVPGRLYRNREGRLEPTEVTFPSGPPGDSAYVMDFNEDGRPGLFLGSEAGFKGENMMYLNSAHGFERLEFPGNTLVGLADASVALARFRPGGPLDVLVCGTWEPQLWAGAALTVVYKVEVWPKRMWLGYDRERMNELPDMLGEVVASDLDGDGYTDLLMIGRERHSTAPKEIMVFQNTNGSLRQLRGGPWERGSGRPLGAYQILDVIPFDIDGDGKLDLLCFPRPGKPVLLRNVSAPGK